MPSGVASPACSAIVQQFLRGRSASNASTNPRTRPRSSIRPNRAATRSSSSSTPVDQPAGPTLARATTARPSDVHTPDDGHAVAALFSHQDQAIYGWSTRQELSAYQAGGGGGPVQSQRCAGLTGGYGGQRPESGVLSHDCALDLHGQHSAPAQVRATGWLIWRRDGSDSTPDRSLSAPAS